MTAVKVECDCGQRYAFDVEPVHGRMPAPVACPVCGADGTAKANAILAKLAPPAPAPAPIRMATAVPVAVAAAVPAMASPIPPSLPRPVAVPAIPAAPPPPRAVMPGAPVNEGVCAECGGVFPTQNMIKYGTATVCAACKPVFLQKLAENARIQKAKATRGKDGWNGPETALHKAGQYLAFTPALLAALVAWRFLSFPAIVLILAVGVAFFGIIGGILNIWGRGPVWAGALVGLVTTLCGFFTVSWWIRFREGDAWWIEVIVAFVLGCAPGILLQPLLQKMLRGKEG
jgi:hypothetical protein